MMNRYRTSLLVIIVVLMGIFFYLHRKNPVFLVYHPNDSTATSTECVELLKKLGQKNDWQLIFTTREELFYPASLQVIDAIVFLNTSGKSVSGKNRVHITDYLKNGGGVVGIRHSEQIKTDALLYGRLVEDDNDSPFSWYEYHKNGRVCFTAISAQQSLNENKLVKSRIESAMFWASGIEKNLDDDDGQVIFDDSKANTKTNRYLASW
jgi:type 1 glutamine amidotransferase